MNGRSLGTMPGVVLKGAARCVAGIQRGYVCCGDCTACGLACKAKTSVSRQLEHSCLSMHTVKTVLDSKKLHKRQSYCSNQQCSC